MDEAGRQEPASCALEFRKECDEALGGLEPKDAEPAGRAADLAYRIARRHPFLFLPDFVEDLINGVPNAELMSKYHVASHVDFANLVSGTLGLSGFRSKKRGEDNRKNNLQKPGWRAQYELVSRLEALREPLESLLACGVLTAAVCQAALRKRRVLEADLYSEVSASHAELRKRVHSPRLGSRTDPLAAPLRESGIVRTARHLASQSYVSFRGGAVSVPEEYYRMPEMLYEILEDSGDGASYQGLMSAAARRLPMLRLVPGMWEFDSCLEGLAAGGRVVQAGSVSRYSAYSRQLFTRQNYERRMARARADVAGAGRAKFFGRSMEPDRFVSELESLSAGDLGDEDDQVTRLAGLVLGDSAPLQSPREDAAGFDFVVDISQYRLSPEQENLMRKLDFRANSSVFHCKAAINETATAGLVRKLAGAVPPGEQGVVFTCRPVPPAAQTLCREDPTVQVVGREGIRMWCSAVRTIPCRRNSAVRAMYGEGVGSVGAVRSLNYESGLATVELVPGGREKTFPIRCLKEIGPDPPNPEDFEEASGRYLQTLRSLALAAPESFLDGMAAAVAGVHATERDMLKSTKPHLFGPGPQSDAVGSRSRDAAYVELENSVCVKVSLPSYELECPCGHRLNQEHFFTMCRHMVAAANCLARELPWPEQSRRLALLRKSADRFRKASVKRAVSAVCDVLDDGSRLLLKNYILMRARG